MRSRPAYRPLLLLWSASAATDVAEDGSRSSIVRPQRISFLDLLADDEAALDEEEGISSSPHELLFWKALETDGFVSITDVFGGGNSNSQVATMMTHLHDCVRSTVVGHSTWFADGTHRRTIAGHSVCCSDDEEEEDERSTGSTTTTKQRLHPALVVENDNETDDGPSKKTSPSSCRHFETASREFRRRVDHVADLVAQQLDTGLRARHVPIRITKTRTTDDAGADGAAASFGDHDDNTFYESMQELVHQGEHLEHFHSYQKMMTTETTAATTTTTTATSTTMDWHKDQGLFLLFTPGRFTSTGALSRDFYVRHDDGVAKLVQFHEDDDLVLLLGDGLTQLIDDDASGGGDGDGDDENKDANPKPTIHVPWHSLSIAAQDGDDDDEARVWYGRIVLPPANAVHRTTGLSYGDLRQQLNDADDIAAVAVAIGCSSSSLTTVTRPSRQLQDDQAPDATGCANNNADQLLCWHQCMAVTDFGVNETFCNGQNLDLACVDRNNVVWNGDHADESAGYQPRCFDLSASNSSLPPPVAKPPPVATDNLTTTTAAATNATTGEDSAAVSVTTLSQLAFVVVVAISCAVIGTV